MPSIQFSEIIVILLLILIVFGPRRLPEIARKAGEFIRKAREAVAAISNEVRSDYGEAIAPVEEFRKEIKGLRDDVSSAVKKLGDAVTIDDVAAPVAKAPDTGDAPDTADDVAAPVAKAPDTGDAPDTAPDTAPDKVVSLENVPEDGDPGQPDEPQDPSP